MFGRRRCEEPDSAVNYRIYRFRKKERWKWICLAGALLALLGWLFYEHWLACLLLQAFQPWVLARICERKGEERRFRLLLAFKDAMGSVSAALSAGYSVENAFLEAGKELSSIYPPEADICREFAKIQEGIPKRIHVEDALADFAERSGIEEIQSLSEMILTGRETGGNLVEIIGACVRSIQGKTEMKREIAQVMAGKRLESRIMSGIPVFMLIYLKICSPGLLAPLYHNLTGILMMSGCLAVYAGAFYLSERIIQIEV